MANQQHLDILKQGVDAWNKWREEHPDIVPDFSEADLRGIDLSKANLHRAVFYNANLSGADLSEADLRFASLLAANLTMANLTMANLYVANLGVADLSNANLSRANLGHADLTVATLRGAILIGADLGRADFIQADLSGADLSHCQMFNTTFGDVDLSAVKGLDAVDHEGQTIIGIDTIFRSDGMIPESFLRGAGVPDTMIEYIRSLVAKPINYYTCFISYSSKDEAFAKRLYADLQSQNVRCWFAPEDSKIGEQIRIGIDEAIRLHDKLLLILSKHSVASGWVEHEVKTALAKERKEKRTVLFPIHLDKAVLESPSSWATEIRHEHNIGDFTRWKNHDDYQKSFSRLLRDLRAASQ